MHWSDTVRDYYPVDPAPRWGFGKPVHTEVKAALDKWRDNYAAALDIIASHRAALHAVSHAEPADLEPFWDNSWFTALDAAALVGFLLDRRPRRYLEIGSGHSTRFARYAIRCGGLSTTITSIDPTPRSGNVDPLCDRVIRHRLEDCDLAVFNELRAGDILFFDGSHRVFPNSDVTTLFFDVLPRLAPGVLVHLHDIFLPEDYPPQWSNRLYSEQYLLGATLLCPAQPFRIVLPNYFVCTDPALAGTVKRIFHSGQGPDIPFIYGNSVQNPGNSFWIETLGNRAGSGVRRPFAAISRMIRWGRD